MRIAAAFAAMAFVAAPALAAPALAAQGEAVSATTPESPLASVFACADQPDPAARLACFDEAVAALKAAESRGDIATIDSAKIDSLQRESFGFSIPSLPQLFRAPPSAPEKTQPPRQIEAKVERVERNPAGQVTLYLDNGQVWRQIDSERAPQARLGAELTIRRAALGSFLLSFKRGGPALRVRRVE